MGFEPMLPDRQSGVLTATLRSHYAVYQIHFYPTADQKETALNFARYPEKLQLTLSDLDGTRTRDPLRDRQAF